MEPIPVVQLASADSAKSVPEKRENPYQIDGATKAPLYTGLPFMVRLMEGKFQTLRRWVSAPMMALFFLAAWIQVDGQPFLLFSNDTQRIVLMGFSVSWHDLPLLAGLMVAAAMLLFFAAVAWGRVWCGFACPQSVWTWVFLRIETLTLGSPGRRQRRAKEHPAQHRVRQVAKHALWMLVAFITAFTFTGYFVPVRELFSQLMTLEMSSGSATWIIIMGGLTYLNAGFVREKICLHACPYSRFQSVMFDPHTRTVSYDMSRGEPRKRPVTRQTKQSGTMLATKVASPAREPKGDCVDCGLCVQVCPVGIDIRDGLQAPCIDCGACIDACDKVMSKLKLPVGLIRFASEHELSHLESDGVTASSNPWLRPRLLGYGAICLAAVLLVGVGFQHTTRLLVEVQRDRDQLYTWEGDALCNHYRLKVERFDGGSNVIDPIRVAVTSQNANDHWQLSGETQIETNQLGNQWLRYKVCSENALPYRTDIQFALTTQTLSVTKATTFISTGR